MTRTPNAATPAPPSRSGLGSPGAPPGGLSRLRVLPGLGGRQAGKLLAGALVLPCVLGPAGLTRRKREGDGGTPVGCFALLGCFYRADRSPRLRTALPMRASRVDDGWCDDPADSNYNQPIRLPFGARHEPMWRADRLYDLGVVIDYNHRRPRKQQGSAIFIHIMAPAGTPTAGCVALRPGDLRRLLPRLATRCTIRIG